MRASVRRAGLLVLAASAPAQSANLAASSLAECRVGLSSLASQLTSLAKIDEKFSDDFGSARVDTIFDTSSVRVFGFSPDNFTGLMVESDTVNFFRLTAEVSADPGRLRAAALERYGLEACISEVKGDDADYCDLRQQVGEIPSLTLIDKRNGKTSVICTYRPD